MRLNQDNFESLGTTILFVTRMTKIRMTNQHIYGSVRIFFLLLANEKFKVRAGPGCSEENGEKGKEEQKGLISLLPKKAKFHSLSLHVF